ncbi:MAG: Lrp/AsnC family transcriptional regulator [Candidatus Diapherotrites archaeon]|jgi:DNA-binding Lrp family transcriptional regulator|uniref:Lrp/AsnC family transcriptional regulator n=1 Tax=Candidatus Iainarchaeum sp. TaxID=3101447 RepID=A0A8T5GDK7_9ARCH|nr:Lrp/AsnC family transcriptional regulator [Candidatus Diapherotrites archaeon]
MVFMDLIDKKIIYTLHENSRTPFSRIGKDLGMSEAAIRQRVKKLVKNEEIKKFTIETNFSSRAIIAIKTSSKIPTKKIIKELKSSHIQHAFEVTGEYSIFVILGTENSEQMNDAIEHIRSINGVIETNTYTILKKNHI